MDLSFVPASPDDVPGIYGFSRALIEQYEDPREIDLPLALQWTRRKIENRIGEYTRILLGGETVGYFRFAAHDGSMELDDLYIFPDFRRRGIGTAAVNRCIAQSDRPIELYVFTQNTGALELYRRLGFRFARQVSRTRCILRREVP